MKFSQNYINLWSPSASGSMELQFAKSCLLVFVKILVELFFVEKMTLQLKILSNLKGYSTIERIKSNLNRDTDAQVSYLHNILFELIAERIFINRKLSSSNKIYKTCSHQFNGDNIFVNEERVRLKSTIRRPVRKRK